MAAHVLCQLNHNMVVHGGHHVLYGQKLYSSWKLLQETVTKEIRVQLEKLVSHIYGRQLENDDETRLRTRNLKPFNGVGISDYFLVIIAQSQMIKNTNLDCSN